MATEKKQTDKFWLLWGHLPKLGNNRVIRSSYFWIVFVPVVAKVLEKFPGIVQVGDMIFTAALPFSWLLFYFAAWAFGLATLMFSLNCPPLIRDFKDWTALKDTGRTTQQMLVDFSNWLRNGGDIYTAEGDKVEHDEAVDTMEQKFCVSGKSGSSSTQSAHVRAKNLSIRPANEADAFWHIRGLMQADKPKVRLAISTLYIIGFILITIVLIQNFIFVLKALT